MEQSKSLRMTNRREKVTETLLDVTTRYRAKMKDPDSKPRAVIKRPLDGVGQKVRGSQKKEEAQVR